MVHALTKTFYQWLEDEDIYLGNGQTDDQPLCIRCTKVVNVEMGLWTKALDKVVQDHVVAMMYQAFLKEGKKRLSALCEHPLQISVHLTVTVGLVKFPA